MKEKIEKVIDEILNRHGLDLPAFSEGLKFTLTDLDLSPANRTLANMWQAEALKAQRELRNANKGIARLKWKVERLRKSLTAPCFRRENES